MGAALRDSRLGKHVRLLGLGFRQTVTDHFVHERLDPARPADAPGPKTR